ncbi:hypothetical protein [Streptomyces sp. MA5143a]|uniref:hypothetical protein n=1 Tax=Streptomyces sp. MA5143a TaxID=2083010 RepID=UPI000D1C103B|nr:hypothetical protein [Streptomyces sp. MA5143a]SPF00241.1 hypothetical protein SMA5143A_0952 [Streptomyces sp. MA5143a]
MHFSAAVTNDGSSSLAWLLVAALAGLAVFLVGFYGSQKEKPVGLELGFYPALFLGAGGAAITTFGLLTLFSSMDLI